MAEQSASTTQPPTGMHLPPVAEHAPLRQTVPAFPAVQVPVPFANPHLLSGSQTPATHTAVATSAAHVPVSAGVCPAIVGMAVSFASFAVHVEFDVSQNCEAAHCASVVHAP